MQKEMLPLPQGTAIIPTEYTIFLSDGDDKEWQGVKRRGLEQGLYHILAERAREIAGKKKLETKSFVIELRIDGTLEKGEVRVQHSWEESSSNKTGVLARPKSKTPANQHPATPPATAAKPSGSLASGRPYSPPTNVQPPNFTSQVSPRQMTQQAQAAQPPPQKAPVVSDEAEIMTSVRPRVSELYKLEIWQRGVRQNVIPIFNMETTVGRGSKSKPVDIALTGDPEISRRHVKIITDGGGNYWVVNEGRNPALIANYELPEGQRVPLVPGTSLAVGSYVLRIQA